MVPYHETDSCSKEHLLPGWAFPAVAYDIQTSVVVAAAVVVVASVVVAEASAAVACTLHQGLHTSFAGLYLHLHTETGWILK